MYFNTKESAKYLQESFRRNIWVFLTIILVTVILINGFDNGKPPMQVGVIFADKLDIRELTLDGKSINSPCNHLGIRRDYHLGTPLNSNYDPRLFSFRNPPQSYLGIRPVFILGLRPADFRYVNFQEF